MKVLVIIGHQQQGSFNHAIAQTVVEELRAAGHEVVYHDLYAERFDPILPAHEIPNDAEIDPVVRRHCDEVLAADGYVIVHPNWWGMPPAILKGWIDRVLRMEIAYRFVANDKGEGVPVGLLKARAAVVFNTANTPGDREKDWFGDPLEILWKKCVFDLCGVKNVQRRTFTVVITSTPEQRAGWLKEVRQIVASHFPAAASL